MSTQANEVSVRTIAEEGFQKGNLDALDKVVASDYIEHFPLPPGSPTGLAGLKQFIVATRSAFPDLQYTIEDMVAEGDKVVARCRASGTQTGSFLMLSPTGKRVTWTEIHIARLADGKLAEHWANLDQLGMLQQLGAVPAMG